MRRVSTALAVAAVLMAGRAAAVPAPPFALTLRNADGSTVQAHMFGDERLSWFEDLQGFDLAFDRPSKSWHYAVRDSTGALRPSGLRAGQVDPVAAGLTPHLGPDLRARQSALQMRPRSFRFIPGFPAASGQVHNLVLLVKFTDQKTTYTKADFDPVFNGPQASVRDYYHEVSYNSFDLVSTITDWIPLKHDAAYYAYNAQNPSGSVTEMFREAIDYLVAHNFDFTPYDANHDGIIDAVDIIHSGMGYETTGDPSLIHSHFADLRGMGGEFTAGGLSFVAYHTEPEFGPSGRSITQIGVICHETAHFFGLPDLYDYNYASGGLGLWSVMSMGPWAGPGMDGSVPTHPDAWSKEKLGFVTPIHLAATTPGLTLPPAEQTAESYRLDDGMPARQFFLLENRQATGYDAYLPGEGMLIFHVDESVTNEDNPNRYLVDLEQADGKRELNKYARESGDANDPFPTASNHAFTPLSNPSSLAYGARTSSIFVENIARQGTDVTFDVTIKPPAETGASCTIGGTCQSGYCVDGVCCDQACEGACQACTKAKGASADGTCTGLSGVKCDDGTACTENDVCDQGVCRGTARSCPATACRLEGICDFHAGGCVQAPGPDGVACDDSNPCTFQDACKAGQCTGSPVQCPVEECQASAACDRNSGACLGVNKPDGTECSRGHCASGKCVNRCGCSSIDSSALPLLGLASMLAGLRRRRGR